MKSQGKGRAQEYQSEMPTWMKDFTRYAMRIFVVARTCIPSEHFSNFGEIEI